MTVARLAEPALVTDRVFTAMRDAIMSGEIAPGSRLRLRDLAAQLGTSPMPVREAIGRLEQNGLVVRLPHRGAVVVELTADELVDVYDTRLLLECEAARLGSRALDNDGVVRMRAAYADLTTAVAEGRTNDALDHDEALLSVLYEAAGNPVLVDLINNLWRRCRPYKLLGVRQQGELDLWSEQPLLIAAVAEGDSDTVVALTRRALEEARHRIDAVLGRPER